MNAVQLIAPDTLVLRELPSRALRAHELRIRVHATCVCGSDLKNARQPVVLPQVPGHEFSGNVLELGPECAKTFKPGDRVTVFPMMSCMHCPACMAGNLRDCDNKPSLGFQLPGSFAEEVIVDERLTVPLIDGLSYEQGALIEHLCCGYRLAKEIQNDRPAMESAIVIIGDGPIALADVQSLRAFGFANITILGKHASRLTLARELGAARVLTTWSASEPAVDICIFAAPAEETLERVVANIPSGGIIYPQTRIQSPTTLARMEESGISMGRAFAYFLSDFAEVMELVKQGRLQTEKLITTRLRLQEVPQMFATFAHKQDHFKILITNG